MPTKHVIICSAIAGVAAVGSIVTLLITYGSTLPWIFGNDGNSGNTCFESNVGSRGIPDFNRFTSCPNLIKELKKGSCYWYSPWGRGGGMIEDNVIMEAAADEGSSSSSSASKSGATPSRSSDSNSDTEYSGTNNQVKGVDEADIVKTDGKYIFTLSRPPQKDNDLSWPALLYLSIVEADSLIVHSNINLKSMFSNDSTTATDVLNDWEGFIPSEMFLNGDRLVVIGSNDVTIRTSKKQRRRLDESTTSSSSSSGIIEIDYVTQTVVMLVVDVSDKSNPKIIREIESEGYYNTGRMINDMVFIVMDFWPRYYAYDFTIEETESIDILPLFRDSSTQIDESSPALNTLNPDSKYTTVCECADVGYSSIINPSNLVTILAFSVAIGDDESPVHTETIAGRGNNVYASLESIYLASPNYMGGSAAVTQILAFDLNYTSNAANPIEFRTTGSVPGYVLNQFSMDEYADHFRIATTVPRSWDRMEAQEEEGATSGGKSKMSEWSATESNNNLYIVRADDLTQVGQLEGLAPGESIKSVRFMQDKVFMVTFVQIDPLFVIDASDPTNPHVLGELKIPGYSDYLHPVNETHLLGLGHDTIPTEWGGVMTAGVKLSLFDVSNVTNPLEVSNIILGGVYSSSEATNDHKAFLYDSARNIIAFPITITHDTNPDNDYWIYSDYTWFSGGVVIQINETSGILELQSKFSHVSEDPIQDENGYYYNSPPLKRLRRFLFINETLYATSGDSVSSYDLTQPGLPRKSIVLLEND